MLNNFFLSWFMKLGEEGPVFPDCTEGCPLENGEILSDRVPPRLLEQGFA